MRMDGGYYLEPEHAMRQGGAERLEAERIMAAYKAGKPW